MEIVTRSYIKFCDTHNIEREVGMMVLHAEQLVYLSGIEFDSIPLLDQEEWYGPGPEEFTQI